MIDSADWVPAVSSPPKVAVLLATYNGQDYVAEQISSILAQVGVEVDIFISDDGSTDTTIECLKAIGDDRIKQLQYGPGMGAAQNFLSLFELTPLKGYDFIALSDQDDIWKPEKLLRATASIREKKLDAYSGNVTAFWPDGTEKIIFKSFAQRRYDYLFEAGGPGNTYVFPSNTVNIIRTVLASSDRAIVDKVLAHDWLFYSIVRHRGMKWWIDQESYVLYRQHGKNLVGAGHTRERLWSRLMRLLNGSFFDQVEVICRILSFRGPEFDFVTTRSFKKALKIIPRSREYRRNRIEAYTLATAILAQPARLYIFN